MTSTRDIIEINEDLCNGCGECLASCAEGALAIVDGKAKLISDVYCDGLGACLGHCPQGALKVIKREAPAFDEAAALAQAGKDGHGCPGSREVTLKPDTLACGCPGNQVKEIKAEAKTAANEAHAQSSQLLNWPLQLMLAPPKAGFFDNERLILASDCSGFVLTNLHDKYLDGKTPLVIACPKLDDKTDIYLDKLSFILKAHPQIKELVVLMMTVPCCGGLGYLASRARNQSGRELKITMVYLSPEGLVESEETV